MWHWSFAVQVVPFIGMLLWAYFGKWPVPDERQQVAFNLLQAILLSGFICGVTYLLLRGERFNWFRDPEIVKISLLTLVAGIATLIALRQKWGKGEYIRTQALSDPHGKVGMLDAAVAGFVILGTTLLISTYVTQVMHYNHEQLGRLEMISFAGMLTGLGIALFATTNPSRNPEKVIPIGVSIMLLACVLLTGSNSGSGVSDMWLPLLLKGLAIGILNITLTVHILRTFPKHHVVEGIAWFYLFRNLGSMLAITEFSRVMYIETVDTASKLAENFNASSEVFNQKQQLARSALQQGLTSSSPEQVAIYLSDLLKTQALSVAGVNSFQWLIFSIVALVPVMVLSMKWATNHPHNKGG